MKKNSRISTSSQELEDSRLRENGQDSKQSPSVKKKNSVKKSSKSIGRKSLLLKKSETSMERNGEEQLSLLGVFPVNLSLLPDSDEAKKMTAISGRKCLGLLVKRNPIGYLQRMCLESSEWHSTRCLLTWKAKVTPQGHLLFQLVASMHRTEEIESGLLRTPSSVEHEGGIMEIREGVNAHYKLRDQIAMLPTPRPSKMTHENEETWQRRKDRGGVATPPLSLAINMLPTPLEDDSSNVYPSEKRRETLVKVIDGTSGKKTGMKLQPAFVEWMMGFPIGFTDLNR